MNMKILFALIIATMVLFGCTQVTTTDDSNNSMMDNNDSMIEEYDDSMMEEDDNTEADNNDPMMEDNNSSMMDSNSEVVVFTLTGENFAFFMDGEEAPTLTVSEGDTVRIEFTSTDGFHDFVIDEFDAATEQVMAFNSTFVEFVADQKGTFEYYCSVGQHRQNGMVGTLIVE